MIKQQLVERLSAELGITDKESLRIVEAFCNAIKTGLQKDRKVMIRNFGTFTPRDMKGYVGNKPWTKGRITIPARRYPWFRPSKKLNAFVNNCTGGRGGA